MADAESPDSEAWYEAAVTKFRTSPIHETFGMTMNHMGEGTVEILLECPPEFRNGHGNIHGGVLTTALDSAIVQSVRARTPGIFQQATIELKVNFLRPGKDSIVRVVGTAIHVGRTTGVAQATAFATDGRPIATGLGTVHINREA